MTMHEGHRQRMRERFRKEGLDGFAPHEVLELLLFYTRARGDVNPLAHALIDAFGSLKGVLEARPEQLMSVHGVGEETATLLSMMLPVFRRYQAALTEETQHLRSRQEARQYCQALLTGLRTERLYALCLDADQKLLGRRLISEGGLTEVAVYPRLIAETALNYNAHGVILCHNHPTGRAMLSEADLETTLRIQRVLEGMDIRLLDHIIVGHGETYSMAERNDLDREKYLFISDNDQSIAADAGGKTAPVRPRANWRKEGK